MRKLKFIGFIVALVLMATSLTSCLSNSDNNGTNYGAMWCYVSNSYLGGGKIFKTLDGKTTFTATNGSAVPANVTGVCYIQYTVNQSSSNGSSNGSAASTVTLTYCQMIDNVIGSGNVISENEFEEAKDTLATSASKWTEGSLINAVGVNLYSNSNPDFNSTTTYSFPIHKFEVDPTNLRLILGLNYGWVMPSDQQKALSIIKNSHRFYLVAADNALQDGTLTLTLKHYIAMKDVPDNPGVQQAVGSQLQSFPDLIYYSFKLGSVVNAGNLPSKIVIKIEQDNQGWKKGDNTKEASLEGASPLTPDSGSSNQ